jgi:hypothetical protein
MTLEILSINCHQYMFKTSTLREAHMVFKLKHSVLNKPCEINNVQVHSKYNHIIYCRLMRQ